MDYTAEIFDQLQWLFDRNGFNDHQLAACWSSNGRSTQRY